MTPDLRPFFIRLYRTAQALVHKRDGAVLVEFAIIANLILVLNLLAYDYAIYFKERERAQHAVQFIYNGLSRDADHIVKLSDLVWQTEFLNAVHDNANSQSDSALLIVGAIPYFMKDSSKWVLLVCWSWSSNLALTPALSFGEPLADDDLSVLPWIPSSGFSPSSALLIVKAYHKNTFLFDVSILPDQFEESVIGPVHRVASRPINLMYYSDQSETLLNDKTRRENTSEKSVACTR